MRFFIFFSGRYHVIKMGCGFYKSEDREKLQEFDVNPREMFEDVLDIQIVNNSSKNLSCMMGSKHVTKPIVADKLGFKTPRITDWEIKPTYVNKRSICISCSEDKINAVYFFTEIGHTKNILRSLFDVRTENELLVDANAILSEHKYFENVELCRAKCDDIIGSNGERYSTLILTFEDRVKDTTAQPV